MTVRPVCARTHRCRLRILGLVFTILATGYIARLVQLQILQGSDWERIARGQSAKEIEVPAPRGGIFDREGRALVLDDLRYRAYLAPKEISDVGLAIEAASRILGLSANEETRLRGPKSGWVPLPGRLTDAERDRLLDAIPVGIHFASVPARTYPLGDVGRLLLGAMNSEGEALSGLELQLDDFLRGEPGTSRTRIDANGGRYWLPGEEIAVPRSGRDVILTIDADLQRIAENELKRALAETGSTAGDIVLLEPGTGALLAVASKHQGAKHVPVFTDPYEPGSTLKPFLLAALLSEDLVDLNEVIDAEGGTLKMGRRVIRDVHPNNELTVSEVVTYSSNVGAAKLSQRLRPAVQYRYLRDFGFGTPTGIEYPSESGGRLARPREWTSLSQASLAMGYEISTTSLQLAASYAALANDGILMRPYLIREVRDETGQAVQITEPQVLRRVVSAEVASQVTEVLQSVVYEGTGRLASMASLAVAGKTGTARLLATEGGYASGRYRASFVGYAPADDPQVVILTRLEDPQGPYYGGVVAAPTSHATLEAALATQGMRLDRRLLVREPAPGSWGGGRAPADAGPFIFAVGSDPAAWAAPPTETQRAVIMPDLSGLPLRSAVARLHELGLRVELTGTVQVSGQAPAPGQNVTRGATVVLR